MVSVITVNYNGWRDTCEMIASLAAHETYPYEIIVVDNASKGDDADRIAEKHPEVTLVRSKANLGFAGGNNLALPYAKGEYLLFLNNDIEIDAPFLEPMVRRLQDSTIGGVSPLIRDYTGERGVQYAGYWRLTPITLRNPQPAPDDWMPAKHTVSHEIEVMHGAAMMVSRSVLDRVGPLRETYFLFYEEFDWSYRILDAGYHIWFEADATVYHKEGGSIGKVTPTREYYMVRARLLFVHYHSRGWRKLASYAYLLGPVLLRNILRYTIRREWSLLRATIRGSFFFCTKKTLFSLFFL